jgi:PAS domain S-box-containing protein
MGLQLFHALSDLSPYSVSLARIEDGCILKANKKFFEQTGLLEENVIGRTSIELGFWPDPAHRAKVVHAIKEHGQLDSWPTKFRMSSGEIRDFSFSAKLVEFKGMQCWIGTVIDISEHRLCEEALIEKDIKISHMESRLQDFNTTLRVLSEHYESEKYDQYKRMLANIEKSVLPYLEKLKVGFNLSFPYQSINIKNIQSLPDITNHQSRINHYPALRDID